MGKLTKEQIVAWVNENMRDDNYVVLYKRHGEDKNQKKIEKPHITPIETNRDAKSEFLAGIQNSQVEPIQPVFVDFDKDMSVGKMGNGHRSALQAEQEQRSLQPHVPLRIRPLRQS